MRMIQNCCTSDVAQRANTAQIAAKISTKNIPKAPRTTHKTITTLNADISHNTHCAQCLTVPALSKNDAPAISTNAPTAVRSLPKSAQKIYRWLRAPPLKRSRRSTQTSATTQAVPNVCACLPSAKMLRRWEGPANLPRSKPRRLYVWPARPYTPRQTRPHGETTPRNGRPQATPPRHAPSRARRSIKVSTDTRWCAIAAPYKARSWQERSPAATYPNGLVSACDDLDYATSDDSSNAPTLCFSDSPRRRGRFFHGVSRAGSQ